MGNSFAEQIGRRIRTARERLEMTQKDVGDTLGLSDVGVGNWERGERTVPTDMIPALARLLSHSVGYFFDEPSELSDGEDLLLAMYRALSEKGKQVALDSLRTLKNV